MHYGYYILKVIIEKNYSSEHLEKILENFVKKDFVKKRLKNGKKPKTKKKQKKFPSYMLRKQFNCVSNTSSNVINSNTTSSNSVLVALLFVSPYMSEKNLVSLDISEVEDFGKKILDGSFYASFEKHMHTIHHFDKKLKEDQYLLDNVRNMFGREFDGDMEDIRKVLKKNISNDERCTNKTICK